MRTSLPLMLLSVVAMTGAAASETSYVGKWKLNPAKSDFGESTITFEESSDGAIKVTADGQTYTVKADGKPHPTPWGTSVTWKAGADGKSWERAAYVNGKVTGTSTLKLAADGKSLTVDAKPIAADGTVSSDTAVYERVSGASGLSGKWKTKNLKIGAPGTMILAANGADGVTITFVEEKGTCAAKFDGKDHPATGPIWPSGWTCVVAKQEANGFDVMWKKDGKAMFGDSFRVAADGRTLTDISKAPATSESVKAIYERL
jgi:hypothetical protein